MTTAQDRTTTFNYLVSSVESSLYRNGRVGLDRDPDGSDSNIRGLDMEAVEVTVHDARALATAPTCGRNGFELLDAPLADPAIDFFDADQVVRRYYREAADIVANAVGASYATAFDHNVRWASGKKEKKRLENGQEVQAPIQLTHGDYTLTSAPERLRQLAKPPSGNDTLKGVLPEGQCVLDPQHVEEAVRGDRRFAIINLWRNIDPEHPVQAHPLGLCDAVTVSPKDLVVFELHYQDRIGENYFVKHQPSHRWHFFPEMTRDEPVLILQWDSAGAVASTKGEVGDGESSGKPASFSLHSAFEDPTTTDESPDRQSIEVRCVVMYD